MEKKFELGKDKQLEFLKKMIKSIFGYNTELDFKRWNIESDKLVIRDIDFTEDLLTILQRLREYFYVDLDTDIKEEVWEGEYTPSGKKEKMQFAILNIELYLRE